MIHKVGFAKDFGLAACALAWFSSTRRPAPGTPSPAQRTRVGPAGPAPVVLEGESVSKVWFITGTSPRLGRSFAVVGGRPRG